MLVATLVGTRRWPAAVDGWLLVEPTPEQRKLIALPEGPFTRKMMIPFAVALLLVYGFSLYRSPAYAWIAVAVFVAGFAWLSVSAARYDELARRRSELMDDPARVRSMRHLSFRVLRPDLAPSDVIDRWGSQIDEYFARFVEIDAALVGVSDELYAQAEQHMMAAARKLASVDMGYEAAWAQQRREVVDDRLRRQHDQMARDEALRRLLSKV